MKTLFTRSLTILLVITAAMVQTVRGQLIMNPSDTVVTYNGSTTPAQPVYGQIGKWIRTADLESSWNTNEYKCYIYKGYPYRLHFPKSYNPTANDGKKYPLLIFYHGAGEAGPITDNELQLYHGGQIFQNAVDGGTWDGFVLCMQTQGGWGPYQFLSELVDTMVKSYKVDPFHVVNNGLSGGAQGTWEMFLAYPTYIAGLIPMSGVYIAYTSSSIVNEVKFTPIWNLHGGQDGGPAPATAQQVTAAMLAGGADYVDKEYITLGHDTWDSTWEEPNFWPFLLNAYSSNPWTLFGRNQFCPGDVINLTVGLPAGFQAYKWRMNGTIIPGATSNTINVTAPGIYDAQVERSGIWSDWSHHPDTVSIQTPTVTPPITVSGVMSDVLPDAGGQTFVNLQVPAGYASYTWEQASNDSIVGTSQTLKVTKPGSYIVSVTQQYGCSSIFSPPFKVISASGPNPPSPASNLVANALSFTQVQLNWARNPNPVHPEVAFEVYRSTTTGGPYTYVGQAPADTVHFVDSLLTPNKKYYYVVRAIDSTAAAPLSNEANAVTQSDKTPPTAPGNLKVVSTSQTSVSIIWNQATDNVGVAKYLIYINGAKSYSTTDTSFVLSGLNSSTQYAIYVVAQDISGNNSTPSNQVSAAAIFQGLNYNIYTTPTGWSVLPNFSTLTPVQSGTTPTVNITNSPYTVDFGYTWTGYIQIPVAGTYYFGTSSDDGSALWFNSLTPTGTPTVNNDGLHGTVAVTSAGLTLQPGVYPICIEYFQNGGGYVMQATWACSALFGNTTQVPIAAQYFTQQYTPAGTAPAIPTVVKATTVSYNKVNITWHDNSNNETGFEVYRATTAGGPFTIVATAAANTTSFTDSTCAPATTYYYEVQAINKYGSSGFDPSSASGLTYSYYTWTGNWSNMALLNTLTPVSTGNLPNVSLSPATQTTDFAFKFAGYISIPTTGTYTFYTASDDGSDLYVGGYDSAHLVVKNDFLQGTTQRSGTVNLTAGSYPIYITYFQSGGGTALTASYQGPGIPMQAIPNSAFVNPQSMATTLALPAAPTAPVNASALSQYASGIKVAWQDTSTSVTSFQLYRSISDSAHFVLQGTIPAGTFTYADVNLFPNQQYFYKVDAVGVGGTSAFTKAVYATTKDSVPVITNLGAQSIHYGITTTVAVSATSSESGTLTLTAHNLPAFGSFVDNGNGTGTITFSPSASNLGTYNNLYVVVADAFGGADTTTFNLSVNNNYAPTVNSVSSVTMNEGDTLSIPLVAQDLNTGDTLSIAVGNLPGAYTLTQTGNGKATLFLHPSYSAAGTYNVTVTANDKNGLSSNTTFTLTVNYKNPATSIYVRPNAGDAIGAPWNTLTGVTTTNLLDNNGNATSVGLTFTPWWWWNTYPGAPSTGNNSGVYPDAILKDYMYFGISGGPDTEVAVYNGLDTTKAYNLTFFASGALGATAAGSGTSFTIGNQSVALLTQGNTSNTVSLTSIKPASDGSITVKMGMTAGTTVGYWNAMVLTIPFDDGTAPAAPKQLTAQNVSGKGVQLSWTDVAYNATGYQVYRTTGSNPFALIGTLPSNATGFIDSTVSGGTLYSYTAIAVNSHGQSSNSDTASITTLTRLPQVNPIANVVLKNNQQQVVTVTTNDDPTAQLALTVSNLPPFATFVDNGNGTGTLTIAPPAGTSGSYPNVTVTATDQNDSTGTASFNISIVDKDVASVYVNFSDGSFTAPLPWNTLSAPPFANTALTNLTDDGGNATGMSLTLVDGFQWNNNTGMQPEEGTGLFPNGILKTAEFESSSATHTIRLAGLSSSKLYNVVFFNSHSDGLSSLTDFTINGTTVALQGSHNIAKTVEINGLQPDANGGITITVAKDASASYAFLTAMIIESYNDTISLVGPTGLRVMNKTRTAVNLIWQDRSYNETGFELWRANDSASSSFVKIATLPAGTTSYKDSTVSPNTTYYYSVRAAKGSYVSTFSNAVGTTTYASMIYIHPTVSDEAAAPWNNLNAPPVVGYTWSNLADNTGVVTSLTMTNTTTFAGDQPLGQQTGNNSGIYPDIVMMDNYIVFAGTTGTMLLSNLDLSMKYDITLFGSTNAWGDYSSIYQVNNGISAILNASVNVDGTVTVYGVAPDANGNITLATTPTLTSGGGYLGAFIVQGYVPSSNSTPPTVPGVDGSANSGVQTAMANTFKNSDSVNNKGFGAYPNPFQQSFTLSVPVTNFGDRALVTMYDVTGNLVYSQEFDNLIQGSNYLQITPQNVATAGVYTVKVSYASGTSKVILVVKKP